MGLGCLNTWLEHFGIVIKILTRIFKLNLSIVKGIIDHLGSLSYADR